MLLLCCTCQFAEVGVSFVLHIHCMGYMVHNTPEFAPLAAGAATRLESQFRLTYSMILNLLRVEDLKVCPLSVSSGSQCCRLELGACSLSFLYPIAL